MSLDFLFRPSVAAMRRLNFGFTWLFFAGTGVLGPVSSVLAHVALVWAFVRLGLRSFALHGAPQVRAVALAFSTYPLAELVSVAANGRGLSGLAEVVGQILFLGLLPIASRLAVSGPRDILAALAGGAAAGAGLAFALNVVQVLWWFEPGRIAEGGLGNPTVLSVYGLFCLAICLAAGLAGQGGSRVLPGSWLLAGGIAAIGCILLSGIRLSMAMIPVVLVLVLAAMGLRRPAFQARQAAAVAVLLGLVALIAAPIVIDRAALLAANVEAVRAGQVENSLGHRIRMLEGGWALVQERPWFGHGPDSLHALVQSLPGEPMTYTHFHNVFLNALLRGGVLELAAVLACFIAPLAVAWRRRAGPVANAGRALILSLVAIYVLPGLFRNGFDHDILNALYVYGMVVGLCLMTAGEDTAPDAAPDAAAAGRR